MRSKYPKINDYFICNRDFYTLFSKSHEVFQVYNLVGRDIQLKSYFGRIITIKDYEYSNDFKLFNKINDITLSKKIKAKFKSDQAVVVSLPGFQKMNAVIHAEHLIYYKNKKPTVKYTIKFLKELNAKILADRWWTEIKLEQLPIPEECITSIINYNDYWAKLNEVEIK